MHVKRRALPGVGYNAGPAAERRMRGAIVPARSKSVARAFRNEMRIREIRRRGPGRAVGHIALPDVLRCGGHPAGQLRRSGGTGLLTVGLAEGEWRLTPAGGVD